MESSRGFSKFILGFFIKDIRVESMVKYYL